MSEPSDTWSSDDVPSHGEAPTHAMDADLTIYWPWVRPCWEEE
jgi:hypothetical protein